MTAAYAPRRPGSRALAVWRPAVAYLAILLVVATPALAMLMTA